MNEAHPDTSECLVVINSMALFVAFGDPSSFPANDFPISITFEPASMKLTGEENWPLFKDAIENLLDVNGLGRFISAKAKLRNEVDDEDENGWPEYTKWKEWKSSDSKAKLILLYNIDKSLVGLIHGK